MPNSTPTNQDSQAQPKRVLGVFTLAMISFAAIVSLRNLPLTAEYGLASIFFNGMAGLLFFIPVSLVAAELATTWPKNGGLYVWVEEAFGPKYAFLAVWFEWIQNVVWNPTALSFLSATAAYVINPGLAENKFYTIAVVLAVFWGSTLLNFLGMKASGFISSFGSIAGTLIPGALIIALGVAWVVGGNSSAMSWSPSTIIPGFELDNLSFFAGVILGLAGMEMSAFHANEAKNPQRDYPKAILLTTLLILAVFILGSLAIAVVVPATEISLVAGLMQGFEVFFEKFHMGWAVRPIAAMVAIGALAQISTWIIGPSKGILAAAKSGVMPRVFTRTNKKAVPVSVLISQAGVVTLLSLVFLIMPSVSSSYWALSALTAQLTVLMYLLLFGAAIRLRYSRRDTERPYKVPGGLIGMWVVAGAGIGASLFTFFIGFVPPSQVSIGNPVIYITLLTGGILAMSIPPFIFMSVARRRAADNSESATDDQDQGASDGTDQKIDS